MLGTETTSQQVLLSWELYLQPHRTDYSDCSEGWFTNQYWKTGCVLLLNALPFLLLLNPQSFQPPIPFPSSIPSGFPCDFIRPRLTATFYFCLPTGFSFSPWHLTIFLQWAHTWTSTLTAVDSGPAFPGFVYRWAFPATSLPACDPALPLLSMLHYPHHHLYVSVLYSGNFLCYIKM